MGDEDRDVEDVYDIPEGEFCVYGTVILSVLLFLLTIAAPPFQMAHYFINRTIQVYTVPEHADNVEDVYKETTRLAQAEEGVVYYCISRDPTDPSIFHFFERYKSKQAFHQHIDQEIIQKLVKSGWMKDVKAVFVEPITP